MNALDALLSGQRVRIDYHGRAVDATFQRRPIDHIRLDDARGGRIQLRYMPRTDLSAWLSRHAATVKEKPAVKKLALLALLGIAAAFASPAVAQDALTIYTPTATYSYLGEVLGMQSERATNGAVGFVVFGTSGIPPIIDNPRFFGSVWTLGGWTVELSPEQTVAEQCQLHELVYLSESGIHVYLRCKLGPPS